MTELTHFDAQGASRMVDVTDKEVTFRMARAVAFVRMQPATLDLIQKRQLHKGDVLDVARLAGIMGAKRTSDLIPLCHPLAITGANLTLECMLPDRVRIEAEVRVTGQTGVEMEALMAVSIAALTLYDMCKAVDRGMVIEAIHLQEKAGGRSGHFVRKD